MILRRAKRDGRKGNRGHRSVGSQSDPRAATHSLFTATMPLTLNCYYPAEDPRFFALELGEQDRVNILVKKTRELLEEYGINIKLSELQLFKVCFSFYSS